MLHRTYLQCLLLLRFTGTESKTFVGVCILLPLAQFDILLFFVPLVRLVRFRIVLLFIFFVLRFVTITLFTFNGVRSRRIHINFLIVILSLIINLHYFVLFAFAIVLFCIQFNPLLLSLCSFQISFLVDIIDGFLQQLFTNFFAGLGIC